MVERLCCHGPFYEQGNLDHLLEADTTRRVIVDQIGVPIIAFSIYSLVADPRI